ncbi:hypothetical protein [Hymenobacter coccineus]|uniref:hypothetical protein n=1 Tax=Hymenobacter coccineus TaxID=1908235 RepID=UPI001300EC46|nr:hypothetical protein [Hymenobacter coccineus]
MARGFGPRPQDVAAGLSPRKALRQLLRDSEQFVPLDAPTMHFEDPLGAVMAVPPGASTPAKNPVPTGMVTTPDQATTAMSSSPAEAAPPAPVAVLPARQPYRLGPGACPGGAAPTSRPRSAKCRTRACARRSATFRRPGWTAWPPHRPSCARK